MCSQKGWLAAAALTARNGMEYKKGGRSGIIIIL